MTEIGEFFVDTHLDKIGNFHRRRPVDMFAL
jgi:hypothetical protein